MSSGGAAKGAAPVTLIAIGDSTGIGVGAGSGGGYVDRLFALLRAAGCAHSLLNLSRSGATAADALHDQVPGLVAEERALVSVGIGANDARRGVPPDVFARDFEAIVAGIRACTGAPIVISNVPDISLAPVIPPRTRRLLAGRVEALNRAIDAVAGRHGIPVFDAQTRSRQLVPLHPEYFSADGYHPSDEGYEAWVTALWPIVRAAC